VTLSTDTKYYGQLDEVQASHSFDVGQLSAYLSGQINGFRGPLRVSQFSGGQSNPTYLLETPGRSYVLRRKPPGQLLASAHQIDREFRVLSALAGSGFCVPEPLVYCDDPTIIGTAFYVMTFVQGRIFKDVTMPDLDRATRSAVYDSMNATLARLHSYDLQEIGLADYGRPGNYFGRQIARWTKQYEIARTQNIPPMDWLIEWLPSALPKDEQPRLIHGDFSFHNVLVASDGHHVVAVVDWELSTTGNPLGDLMYHMMEWYRPGGHADVRGSLADVDRAALGVPELEDYVALYCERMGRPVPDNLGWHKAYNLFRVAAIVQSIVGRSRDGSAADPAAGDHAARVPLLAEAAWRFAQEAGAQGGSHG
jgi:aminoglycoside phosphotransferase (APT) family kinase protein